jgi:hypothetical protein
MLVAMMHLREPVGAGSKMRVCISDGSDEYTGRMCRSGTRGQGQLNKHTIHSVKRCGFTQDAGFEERVRESETVPRV